MDDVKPLALPASVDTSAPKAERAVAPPLERKRAEIYKTLASHLLEANGPATEGGHLRVHEHLELRDIKPVMEFDAISNSFVMRPHWKARALLAWWKAHGLEHHSRISPQQFEAAMHEALNGRV